MDKGAEKKGKSEVANFLKTLGVKEIELQKMFEAGDWQLVNFLSEIRKELPKRLANLRKARKLVSGYPDSEESIDQHITSIVTRKRRIRTDKTKQVNFAAHIIWILLKCRLPNDQKRKIGFWGAKLLNYFFPEEFKEIPDPLKKSEHDPVREAFWLREQKGRGHKKGKYIYGHAAAFYKGCEKEDIEQALESGDLSIKQLDGVRAVLLDVKFFQWRKRAK